MLFLRRAHTSPLPENAIRNASFIYYKVPKVPNVIKVLKFPNLPNLPIRYGGAPAPQKREDRLGEVIIKELRSLTKSPFLKGGFRRNVKVVWSICSTNRKERTGVLSFLFVELGGVEPPSKQSA